MTTANLHEKKFKELVGLLGGPSDLNLYGSITVNGYPVIPHSSDEYEKFLKTTGLIDSHESINLFKEAQAKYLDELISSHYLENADFLDYGGRPITPGLYIMKLLFLVAQLTNVMEKTKGFANSQKSRNSIKRNGRK